MISSEGKIFMSVILFKKTVVLSSFHVMVVFMRPHMASVN